MSTASKPSVGSSFLSMENLWPKVTIRECLMYMALYPFIATSAAAASVYTLVAGNALVVGLHIADWLKELSMAKKLSERTSVGRERLELFSQSILDSIRTMLLLLALFVLKFTFLAFCGTIHAIYAALFKKDGSVVGTAIRWFFNGASKAIVGYEVFEGPSAASSSASAASKMGGDANEEIAGLDDELPMAPAAETAEKPASATASSAGAANASSASADASTSSAPAATAAKKKATADQIRASAAARGLNPHLGSGAKRKSSVGTNKANAAHDCEVVHEGPHFNRVARGCLLPIIE